MGGWGSGGWDEWGSVSYIVSEAPIPLSYYGSQYVSKHTS